MLRPKKKITKKEIKKDALITSYMQLTAFYERHKKYISTGVTVLVIVVIAVVVYMRNRSENSQKAATELGEIYPYFDNGQLKIAVDGVPERNVTGLKRIVDEYGSTDAGNLARLYLGDAYYRLGNYDDALAEYEKFSPPEDFLAVSRLAGIGACYEAKSMPRDAAENFEKAASRYPKSQTVAENLNSAARNYARAGDKEKALELYRKLKKNFPTSTYGRDADRFIAQLSV